MPAPKRVKELVEKFRLNEKMYASSAYKEAELRSEFIDPLFEQLNWDVHNKKDTSPMLKDVVVEHTQDTTTGKKKPDYAFRAGVTVKFYVEVKKPSVDITQDPGPSQQLRRYGWNSSLPISILTNFRRLVIYDCRVPPKKDDNPFVAIVKNYGYDELEEKWDEIYSIISREAVWKGSFDNFAMAERKRGSVLVDEKFLEDLDLWRDMLAKGIALRNPQLKDDEEMTDAVVRLLDRIIFLRICEDKGLEPTGKLLELSKQEGIYRKLYKLFQAADEKYNSGLFHFKQSSGQQGHPDVIAEGLLIDDKVLKEILHNLYPPHSQYLFEVLSSDILGKAYEQFLGKVIRLTEGHRAKVEFKPEVKKAGGVYYTPEYIVEYIVDNTVGKLCEGKIPEEMLKLKIIDPACGSGSFLIGAYKRLLQEHVAYYYKNGPDKAGKNAFLDQHKEPHLTIQKKKDILLSCIYGVDIDPQAVEVTKLSLLLTALADETKDTLDSYIKWSQERVLPELSENIKCGNSLVGNDIREMLNELPEEKRETELNKIRPFDWQEEFSDVFKAGGFDVAIGNPPYVRQEMLGDIKKYFQKHYQTYHGIADLYVYFIERGLYLLHGNGLWGNIIANKWMRANYGQPLRKWLKGNNIIEILDFRDLKVFTTATTYPCIMILGKGKQGTSFNVVNFTTLEPSKLNEYIRDTKFQVKIDSLDDTGWTLMGNKNTELLDKLKKIGKQLDEYVDGKIYYGIKTGLNEAFVINEDTKNKLIKEDNKSMEIIKPFLVGKDIRRYAIEDRRRFIIFTRRGININNYPAIKKHLEQFKERLMPKPNNWAGKEWKGRKPGLYEWYEIQDTLDYYNEFEKPKIIYAEIAQRGQFTIDDNKFYPETTGYIIGKDDKYLVGIFNSKLWTFIFSNVSSEIRGGFFRWKRQYMKKLPIRIIDFSNPSEKSLHDRLVALVERMLKLHKDRQTEKLPDRLERIEREIKATDKEIDALVYELYGLTEEEIKIVEGD